MKRSRPARRCRMLPRWLQLLAMAWRGSQRRPVGPFRSPARRGTLQRAPRMVAQPPPPPPSTTRLMQTEYLLKGVYLGLVLLAALALGTIPDDAEGLAREGLLRVNLATLAGFALAMLVAAAMRFREALRARGRFVTFVLFLLLESPTLAYLGILAGTVCGLYLLRESLLVLDPEKRQVLEGLFVPVLGGAAVAGFAFGLLRKVRHRLARVVLILALAGGLVGMVLSWLGLVDLKLFGASSTYVLENTTPFAIQILLGIPFFYLLTFSGHEEESEVEIGVMTGLLGLGLGILLADNKQLGSLAFLLPVVLYFAYTMRVLPGLRILKHAFRGFSYARIGRHRRALQAFRRALYLDPNNRLAREGFWEVHRSLDLDQLANDPQTLALVDLDLCLDRAGSLLLSPPAPPQLTEALRLLDLVLRVDPSRQPAVCYWRAVAHTHAGQVEEAAREMAQLLDPSHFGADNPHRVSV